MSRLVRRWCEGGAHASGEGEVSPVRGFLDVELARAPVAEAPVFRIATRPLKPLYVQARHLNEQRRWAALGQSRTSADVCGRTVSPPNADMTGSPRDVAEGP